MPLSRVLMAAGRRSGYIRSQKHTAFSVLRRAASSARTPVFGVLGTSLFGRSEAPSVNEGTACAMTHRFATQRAPVSTVDISPPYIHPLSEGILHWYVRENTHFINHRVAQHTQMHPLSL